jgi:hypothetical protein
MRIFPHRLGILVVLLAFSIDGGCTTGRTPEWDTTAVAPGPLERHYQETVLDKSPSPDSQLNPLLEFDGLANSHDAENITEISLERTECYGICSIYTVTFYSDGRAIFEGRKYIQPLGIHHAEILPGQFRQLALAALDIGYFDLAETYAALVTDLPTVYTSIVRGGERKVVKNYGNSGPPRLWLLEEQIDIVREELRWKPALTQHTSTPKPVRGPAPNSCRSSGRKPQRARFRRSSAQRWPA